MAREYFYCARCQTRLSDLDFETGRAIDIRGEVGCDACLGELLAPLTLKEQEEILLKVRTKKESQPGLRISRTAIPAVQAPRPVSSPANRAIRPPSATTVRPRQESSANWGVVFFVGMFVLLGLLGSLLYFAESTRPPAPPQPRPVAATPTPPPKPVAPPKVTTTPVPVPSGSPQEALDRARTFLAANPSDLGGQLEAFRKAVLAAEGTPLAERAKAELDALRNRQKETIAKELLAVDQELNPLVDKEEFRRVLDRLEELRKRHAVADWATAIDTRTRDLGVITWKAFAPLRDKAVDAQKRKADAEIKDVKDRIAKWGMVGFVNELDRTLAGAGDASKPATTPTPPPTGDLKPITPELKAYRDEWVKAMALAAGRDLEGAIVLAGRAAEAAKEEAAKAESQADLAILRETQAAHKAAAEVVAKWPRGDKIPLEHLDENLQPVKVFEPFFRATADAVEVMRGGATVTIDFADLTPRSIGELYRQRAAKDPDKDRKVAAFVCLLEGDSDGARAFLAGPPDQIPWKYWQQSAKLAETRANPKEVEARKLYFAAERQHADPKSRAASIAAYRQLLNDHAASAIVQRRRAQLTARRDSAKEWTFLPADLATAGTLKAAKHPKVGDCFIAEKDVASERGRDNYAECSFYALPDTPYKCWVYVGGCCQETFTFFYQATDLTVVDPQTKETHLAEPGANVSIPAKHSITFLKAKHETHGGPKEVKRWEWVALPLPKYAAGGLKAVRIMTDQKGFGAAFAVVSANRTGPPLESEVKAWGKVKETVEEPVAEKPVERDASLVGHWKLDESGLTALDSSGRDNTGVLSADAERTDAKIGKGLVLDGKDKYVTIPNSESLDRVQDGSYTIAAWFKPHSKPAGAEAKENSAYYAILMKTGVHEGLKYGGDQKFAMDHWLADNTGAAAVSGGTYPPGSYHHVTGVVSRMEATVKIYVNGKLEGTNTWDAKLSPRDFGSATWKIGIGLPGGAEYRWSADGTIDDVRVWNRALSANEIKLLAGGSLGPAPTVQITSPPSNIGINEHETVTLVATTSAPERIVKVDFMIGQTVIGSDNKNPFSYAWPKVACGVYTVTARATDKSGGVVYSAPVTYRVGNVILYRAVNLGGGQTSIDGVPYEAKGGKWMKVNGVVSERKDVDLNPPTDAQRASLIRASVAAKEGTTVALENVPAGTYQVYLWVWEDNDSQTYDLFLAGKLVQAKYQSGAAGTWAKLGPWIVEHAAGDLTLSAKGGTACFSGVEVWRVTR